MRLILPSQSGYSGFEMTGCMIKGVFGFRDFFGQENLASIFFRGLISVGIFFGGGIPNKLNTPGNFRPQLFKRWIALSTG